MAQLAAPLVVVGRKWLQQADFPKIAGFAEQFPLDTTYGK
jgi:hypothetical protein